ncbi:glycosyltransferase family 2 protein [Candidatus Borrarchaeum sp.]|uniref:glycosyltransferase n=1 Tax=Candidatus Borrarchaeum sp. TaxID=2846742 RepID=UPI00257C5C30|nr:glycosyltransferase [Candidatus Borrarchaeum sp.]
MREDWPSVSVVVPVHNSEDTIGACLESIFNLDYPKDKLEVIVVDDSTDRTPEIVKRFNVHHIRFGKRVGIGYARRIGVEKAIGELAASTDSDCCADPNWLKELTKHFERPEVGGVGGGVILHLEDKMSKYIGYLGFPAGGLIGYESLFSMTKNRELERLSTANAIFRRKVILDVGNFNSSFFYGGEDVNLSLRIAEQYKLIFEPKAIVHHYESRNTLTGFIKWHIRRGAAYHSIHRRKYKVGRTLGQKFRHYLNLLLTGNSPLREVSKKDNEIYYPVLLLLASIMIFYTGLGYIIAFLLGEAKVH